VALSIAVLIGAIVVGFFGIKASAILYFLPICLAFAVVMSFGANFSIPRWMAWLCVLGVMAIVLMLTVSTQHLWSERVGTSGVGIWRRLVGTPLAEAAPFSSSARLVLRQPGSFDLSEGCVRQRLSLQPSCDHNRLCDHPRAVSVQSYSLLCPGDSRIHSAGIGIVSPESHARDGGNDPMAMASEVIGFFGSILLRFKPRGDDP
jgi:hypothetical protein